MSENRSKTGRFAPGQSGNPGGRPKKRKDLVSRCRELSVKVLDEYEAILDRGKAGEKIEAGKVILAYAYGKPETRGTVEMDVTLNPSAILEAVRQRERAG